MHTTAANGIVGRPVTFARRGGTSREWAASSNESAPTTSMVPVMPAPGTSLQSRTDPEKIAWIESWDRLAIGLPCSQESVQRS